MDYAAIPAISFAAIIAFISINGILDSFKPESVMATKTKPRAGKRVAADPKQRDREMLTTAARTLAAYRGIDYPVTLKLGPKVNVKLPGTVVKAIERACRAELNEEMTTQEAADYLNVSRPYLIKLLDEGKIPYRLVGAHRRVIQADIVNFRNLLRENRRAILDDLIVDAEDLGLYEPPLAKP